jgi:hypothetical protein
MRCCALSLAMPAGLDIETRLAGLICPFHLGEREL